MTLHLLRAGLAALAVCGLWATARAMLAPAERAELPAGAPAGPVAGVEHELNADPVQVKLAIARPVFRADRRAPSAGYDPDGEQTASSPAAPPAPKPALAVSGIVWGDQPAAVIEGIPGVEGAMVLRQGESSAGLKLVRIEGDRVIIRGMDTSWRLTVKEPWR